MLQSVTDYLVENWPGGVWLITGGVLAWFLFALKGACKRAGEKAKEALSKLKELPCEFHQAKMEGEKEGRYELKQFVTESHATLNKDVSEVKVAITYMRDALDSIRQSLQNDQKLIINPYARKYSPMRITDKGNEMIDRVGMRQMVEGNRLSADEYMKDSLSSENPYDIQQFLMEHIIAYPEKFIKTEDLDKLKLLAYNEGLQLGAYLTVAAILIRDRYFSENNIDIDEVDRNDPQKNGPAGTC
jgi:hypothetical protein